MEDRKTMKSNAQNISLENRKRLIVTGILDISSFDENTIVLDTELGGLTVKGSGLHINKLNVEEGNLSIEGIISACIYNEKGEVKKSSSLLGNLFK